MGTASSQANANQLTVFDGYVYWLNSGTYASDVPQKNGGVKRASLASIGTEQVVASANNVSFDNADLTVDADNVYYVGRNSNSAHTDVVTAPASGGGSASAFMSNVDAAEVFSDGINGYFDDGDAKSVRYCGRTAGCSGGAATLVENEEDIQTIIVDDKSVIWSKCNGDIRRIAKP